MSSCHMYIYLLVGACWVVIGLGLFFAILSIIHEVFRSEKTR